MDSECEGDRRAELPPKFQHADCVHEVLVKTAMACRTQTCDHSIVCHMWYIVRLGWNSVSFWQTVSKQQSTGVISLKVGCSLQLSVA